MIGNAGTKTMKIFPMPSFFDIIYYAIETILEGEHLDYQTIQDLYYERLVYSTVLIEAQVVSSNFTPEGVSRMVEYSSLDTDIGTIDSNGRITRVSDGTVRILAKTDTITRRIDVPVELQYNAEAYQIINFADGTLGKNIGDSFDTRITDVTEENLATKKLIYSTQDHTNGIYVRNTSCWAYDIDLTCISPWNSYGVQYRAGTLISPRHIILARHYNIPVGNTLRFVTQDNVVITRTVIATAVVDTSTDLQVSLLDEDVPETITFAKVLPDNWQDYVPGLAFGLPVLYTDQQEKALICTGMLNGIRIANPLAWFIKRITPASVYEKRALLFEIIVGGDSGNPSFFIINNELVILSTWWHSSGTDEPEHPSCDGPNIAYFKTAINTAMSTVGGGYQLTEVDLSGFPTYS